MVQCIEALEREITELRSEVETEKKRRRMYQFFVNQSQREWGRTFDAIDNYIITLDTEKRILRMNRALSVAFNKPIEASLGGHCYHVLHDRQEVCKGCPTDLVMKDHKTHTVEYENRRLGKSFLITASPIFDDSACLIGIVHVTKDITEKKAAENALKLAYDKMEEKVKERTSQLDFKSRHLEEANTALRLMLKAREEDRQELGEKVITNVKHLLLPYIEKLKNSPLSDSQLEWLQILSANMDHITSSFATTLSTHPINLTPREIEIANLVKNGRTSKEIAELLRVSLRAIEFHRNNIRKKLGLKRQKINLHSYLLSLY